MSGTVARIVNWSGVYSGQDSKLARSVQWPGEQWPGGGRPGILGVVMLGSVARGV